MIVQDRRKRKPTGGRYKSQPTKRVAQIGRAPAMTKVGVIKNRKIRMKGGGDKQKLLSSEKANVYDPKAKKYCQAKIEGVTKSNANRHFVRRNIMTKGTIITTSKGKARVTSRPGQDGVVNAILV